MLNVISSFSIQKDESFYYESKVFSFLYFQSSFHVSMTEYSINEKINPAKKCGMKIGFICSI